MKPVLTFSAVLASFAIMALGQQLIRTTAATTAELEAARRDGAASALADAKNGTFPFPLTQVPKDTPWVREWLDLLPKRGFTRMPVGCISGAGEAQVICFVAQSEVYNQVMLEQIKLHFGEDIFIRLNNEAKAICEVNNAPPKTTKPGTPKVHPAKSKK